MGNDNFDLDLQVSSNNMGGNVEPNATGLLCGIASGVSWSVLQGCSGECLTTQCNSVKQCPTPGPNPTYYSC